MSLFKAKPNLPNAEKARIEFHLQQLVDSIGMERFRLPVLSRDQLLSGTVSNQRSIEAIKMMLGEHLKHDVSAVKLQTFPMALQKVGGGGG